ncbi:MAG: hypothetical protein U0231_00055 [Nitrospiraceae bacterium]
MLEARAIPSRHPPCFSLSLQNRSNPTPDWISHEIRLYLTARENELLPSGEGTKDGRRFGWCGDVFDFLCEGLAERLAGHNITFAAAFPGPFRLLDEDQQPNGQHIRRFWTTALHQGCPIARLCTYFFHRHQVIVWPPRRCLPGGQPTLGDRVNYVALKMPFGETAPNI